LVVARDGDRSRLGPHGLGQRHSLHRRPRTLSRASGVAGRGAGHRVDTAGARARSAAWSPPRESVTGQSVRVVMQRGQCRYE
jgi:hypothetical protein